MSREKRRRTFLRAALVATAGGLAGCSNSGGGGTTEEEEEEEDEEETETQTTTAATTSAGQQTEPPADTPESDPETATEMETTVPEEEVSREQDFDRALQRTNNWLESTSNYDGEGYSDRRGQDNVVVQVGVRGNQGFNAFEPVAIRIEANTTVTWEWTGEEGAHNVVGQQGTYRSGTPQEGGGIRFSHTFENTGWYRYKCTNHAAFGMRGAIFVDPEQTLSGYPQVDDWLDRYEYDGTLDDFRGESTVEITVGASGNGGNQAFRPIAILVSPGTEIQWNWNGRGGSHSIEWEQGDLQNSDATGSAEGSFSLTIDEPGVYLYKCGEHGIVGGRGAIVVNG